METIAKLEKFIDNAGFKLIYYGLTDCRNYVSERLEMLEISQRYDLSLTDQDVNILNSVKEKMKSCFTLQEMITGLQDSYNYLQECKRNILK